VICDVGGGVGNISIQLAERYPALQFILQDLPGQLEIAKHNVWPQHCPNAIQQKRISFIPLDFFKESPKKGCDIYFVSAVRSKYLPHS